MKSKEGFAISIDALFATLLVISAFALIGVGFYSSQGSLSSETLNLKQVADDAFASLDNKGALEKYLSNLQLGPLTFSNPSSQSSPGLYYEAERLLPQNVGLKIVITEYRPANDLAQCKLTGDFQDCFGSAVATESFPNISLPSQKVVHGRRVAVMKETDQGQDVAGGRQCVPSQAVSSLLGKEDLGELMLQSLPIDIETEIYATDSADNPLGQANPLLCYDNGALANETAKVTIKARNSSRNPVAIMLALDRSGSMSTYDMLVQQATGTFQGGVCENQQVWVPGKFGNGLWFNGVNNYINCGTDDSFNSNNELTVAFWVKIDDPNENAWRRFFSKETTYYSGEGYVLRYHALNNEFQFFGNGSNSARATFDLDTGWHHVAVIVSGGTGRIYVDTVDRTFDSSIYWLVNNTDEFAIGLQDFTRSNGNYFKGSMDDIWFFNRALTSGEIAQIYASENAAVTNGLVGHWKLNENEYFIASDSSGNGLDCVLMHWMHVKDWTKPDIGPCETQPGEPSQGTNNCPVDKDFAGHTDRQEVTSYDIGSFFSLINQFPGPGDYLLFNAVSTTYAGECGSVSSFGPKHMRLWVRRPDGIVESDYLSSYNVENVSSSNITNGSYDVITWSDYPVNYHVRLIQGINSQVYDLPLGGGTYSGYYEPPENYCSNYGNWQLLRTVDLSDYNALYEARWLMNYNAYNSVGGQCGAPRFEARRQSDGSVIATTGLCGTGNDNGSCVSYFHYAGYSGPYLSPEVYELWGWSDVNITVDVRLFETRQFWGDIYGSNYDKLVDGGTCYGQPCDNSVVSGSTPYTNCPSQGYNYVMDYLTAQNKQSLDIFDVNYALSGLKANVDFVYRTPNTAVCHAAMNYKHAATSYKDQWYNIYSSNATSASLSITPYTPGPKDLYVNDWPLTPTYYGLYWSWSDGPPIAQGSYEIQGWAEQPVDYDIKWDLKRIDASKQGAKEFIDNGSWKTDDELGLVSFENTASLDQSLTTNLQSVKNAIDAMAAPNGETGTADAINTATAGIVNSARSDAARFLILLTDGKANVCLGGIPCNETQASADAIVAANNARAQGVTIYVIGFADASIIGSYESDLNSIALDKDDPRFSAECANGNLQHCGKYYFAIDPQTLQEMYNLIALDIVRTISDTDITIPVPTGTEFSNYGQGTCGTWDDGVGGLVNTTGCSGQCSSGNSTCYEGETLTYMNQGLGGFSGQYWWAAQFDAALPCKSANCSNDYTLFPPPDTSITETSSGNSVDWDGVPDQTIICGSGTSSKCHQIVPFKYKDLNVAFTYGLLRTGDDKVLIDLEIGSDGNRNVDITRSPTTDGLQVSFYKKDFGTKVSVSGVGSSYWLGDTGDNPRAFASTISDNNLFIAPADPSMPDDVCSWKDGACTAPGYQQSYWKIRIEDIELSGCPNNNCEGTIIAQINQNDKVTECPLHDTAFLFCNRERLRYFTIDYYLWET